MIEIRKTKDRIELKPATYDVFIDGTLLDGVDVQTLDIGDDKPYAIATTTQKATEQLLAYSFLELQNLGPVSLRLRYSVEWNEAISDVWLFVNDRETYNAHLLFSKIDHWHRVYRFVEYFRTLRRYVKEAGVTNMVVEDLVDSEYGKLMPFNPLMISFQALPKLQSIASELGPRIDKLATPHQNVEEELESRFPTDKLEVSFSFPEAVRAPCEQYLLYFTQFLKDLGVEATADLHHQVGKVLFSVLPGNKETALDNIRIALDTYLQLPSSQINEDSALGIAEQRLAANVEHLRSQLRLANATIKAQQVTINLLENEIKSETSSADDQKVHLFGGIVALGKLNKYGVEVNYSEIFKILKRLLGTDS